MCRHRARRHRQADLRGGAPSVDASAATRSDEAAPEIARERDRRDVRADRDRAAEREQDAADHRDESRTPRSARRRPGGDAVTRIAAAAGVQRCTAPAARRRSAPTSATARPSTSMKIGDSGPHRHAARRGHFGVGAGEPQRPPQHQQARPARRAESDQPAQLRGVDRDDLAGEQAELVRRSALVEGRGTARRGRARTASARR